MPKVNLTNAQGMENAIYRHIRQARKIKNVTQSELGREIGITQGGASLAFHNQTLTLQQACVIADALNLEIRICVKE